jgi:hypothetical protein
MESGVFGVQIERIDELPDPDYKTGLLRENAVKL